MGENLQMQVQKKRRKRLLEPYYGKLVVICQREKNLPLTDQQSTLRTQNRLLFGKPSYLITK